jgi:hypothetical protein
MIFNPDCLELLPVLNDFIFTKIKDFETPPQVLFVGLVLKFMNVPKSLRMMSDDAGGGVSMVKKITCSEESRPVLLYCQKGR